MADNPQPEQMEPLASRLSGLSPAAARACIAEASPDYLLFIRVCETIGIMDAARLYLDFWCEHLCFVRAQDRVAAAIGEEAAAALAAAFGRRRHRIACNLDTAGRRVDDDMYFVFLAISEPLADELEQAKNEAADEIGKFLGCIVYGADARLDILHLMAVRDMLAWLFHDDKPVWWEGLRKARLKRVQAEQPSKINGAAHAA